MYLATSRITRGGTTYTRHLLRASYRASGKVLHRTMANVRQGSEAEIAAIRLALRPKGEVAQLGPRQEAVTLKQGLSFGAVWTVYHVARRLGIEQALGPTRAGKLALGQVLARVIEPGSRRAAVRLAMAHAACDVRGFDPLHEETLYENLDWRAGAHAGVEERLLVQRPKTTPVTLFLSDVTRRSLAGTHNALAAFGDNRDGKKGKRQLVIGLLGAEDGHPVAIAVFPGNTQDPQTLAAQLAKVTRRFGVTALTRVGDRGMSKGQPIADLAQQGFHYITAITQPQMETRLRTGTWQMALFDQEVAEGLAEEGLRYVLRRNPVRAQDVRDTRHAPRATLQALVAKSKQYLTDHPRANAQGALQQRVAKAETLRLADGVALTIEERARTLTLNEDAQHEAAKLRWVLWAQNGPEARASPHSNGPRPLQSSGSCRVRVADLQNRAPRRAPPLRTPRSPHPGACVRRHARLSEHPVAGVVLEPLGPSRRRRPPGPHDALSRGRLAPECPKLSLHPHAS